MACGICRHENVPNAKFCSQCGAPLNPRCGSCGSEQPAEAKFCNQCGAGMVDAASRSTPHSPTSATAAVRKNVTALFADLVGSTAFGEQVDPEAARATLAPYFAILKSTIEDHAGTVVKFTGDGIMAMFGVPEIAEDDALRAVAAGKELQHRFAPFAQQVRDRHGVELGLRVGINTGEIVVADDDADMVGDVLNTAARLEAACQPGRVLVGEDTWRLTRSVVAYEVLGEVRVKGKAEAIATFQVVETGFPSVEEHIPFVGRTSELALIHSVFDDSVASSACRLMTVIGAPGVGKTRLASELRAATGARSFDLRIERRGSTTFTPIVDLLRDLTSSGTAEEIRHLVAEHPEADRLGTVLSSFLGVGGARSTEESFWAVRRLLEHLAVDAPIVIVVDDVQWAEPLFWDLLDHLAEWTSAPVLLLALARPELRELRPELTQPGRRVAASVSLEGLDAAATRELAARLLDTDTLPVDLLKRIPESTEGNPLFVRELVQMLVDDGVLARSGDIWHLTIDVDAIEVPPTILSLLASRVERLPDDERELVELASVIGTEFDRGTLGSIAGPSVASRLGALIDRLRRKDLVEPSGTWAGDHPVYRFHHVLVRDAAYRRLLKGHRADLHERVGRYLEEHGGSGDDADVVVAHHYEQVHRYRSELGTVDEATRLLAQRAVHRLRAAAEQALAREDLASSGSYAIRALALAGDDDERDELLVLGCEALLSSGDVARGAPLVEEFRSRRLDRRLAAWADCFHAQLWSMTDSARLSEATDLADDAAGRLDALDDAAGVAKARLVRASALVRLGRVGDCEAELDLALSAARAAGDRRRTVAVLGAAPLAALWGPSPVARAGGRCLDVLRLLRITTSSPAVEATSIRCQGMLEALRGRFDSAREKFETSRTMSRDLGLRHGLYETELFEGFVELIAGDPVGAEPHLVLARDGLGALGIGADAGQASALLARALLRQGRVDEADVLASAALEAAGENLQTAVASRSVLGEIRVEQGRPNEARELIAAALGIVERTDITVDHAIAQRSAARVADRLGDVAQAAAHRHAAERLLADKGVTGLTGSLTASTVTPGAPLSPDDGEVDTEQALAGNAAWAVNEGLWSTWIADDRVGYIALLAPDFQARIHELGPKLAFSGDRYATADVLFEALAGDRVNAIPNRLIAKRGDDLALIAMVFQDGDSTTTMYTVSQTRDGRAVRADTFAEDQLGDAFDELDRRWITLGAPADVLEGLIQLRRTATDGDFAKFRELLSGDFEVVGHGQLPLLDRRSADEFIESIRPLFSDGSLATATFTDIPAITGGAALTQFQLDAADGSSWRLWYLWAWESGRFTRADIYELDAHDAALARFEELRSGAPVAATSAPGIPATPASASATDRELTEFTDTALARSDGPLAASQTSTPLPGAELVNDEIRLGNVYNQVWLRGDIDVEQFLEPDYESSSRRSSTPEVRGRREVFDGLRDFWRSAGAQALSDEVVAIRGDHLALHRLTTHMETGDEISVLAIGQLGCSGRWSQHVYFDVTQLAEAQIELDRMWMDELGFPADHPTRPIAAKSYETDPERAAEGFHPDLAFVNHRRLAYESGDWSTLADVLASADFEMVVTMPRIHRLDDRGAVVERVETAVDEFGENRMILVVLWEDGLTVRLEGFDTDDLDTAVARYDELVADTDEADAPPTVTNAAWVIAQRALVARDTGDRDEYAALHSDRYETVDHERFTMEPGATRNRADHVAFVFDTDDGRRADVTAFGTLVAIRDDDLCLLTAAFAIDDYLVERLVVVETDAGQIVHTDRFDYTDLPAALDQLDTRWVALGGPAEEVRLAIAFREAQRAGDVEAARRLLSDDFVITDHSVLGVGQLGIDDHLATAVHGAGAVVAIPIHYAAHTDSAALARIRFVAPDESSWERWVVTSVGGGLTRSVDMFDLIDLDAARACYDQRVAEAAGPPIDHPGRGPSAFTNAAWRRVLRFRDAWDANDRDRCLEVLGEGSTFVGRQHGHTGITFGAEELVDLVLDPQLYGDATSREYRLIATRGDHLCLSQIDESVDGVETHSLHLVRDGGDAQGVQLFRYDVGQLAEAYAELDRQWVELGGPQWVVDVAQRGREVMLDPGRDRALTLFHPDLVSIDHRQLGLGVRDLDGWLRSMEALGPGIAVFASEIIDDDPSGVVTRTLMTAPDGESTWEFLQIMMRDRTGDDRIVRQEMFDVDQLDVARSRFTELLAADADRARVEHPARAAPASASGLERGLPAFTNAAWEWAQACAGAVESSDRSQLIGLMADDFLTVARYRLNVGQELGREDFADSLIAQQADGDDTRLEVELIAVRGDELALVSLEWFVDASLLAFLLVVRVADGRATHMVMFDDTQLRDAVTELDAHWAELGGPLPFIEMRRKFGVAMRSGDSSAARELLSDDFRSVDHRPLGMGVRNADEWLESARPIAGVSGGPTVAMQPIVWTDDALLYRHSIRATDDLGDVSWDVLTVAVTADGKVTHWDNFDLDQAEAARARFDELTARSVLNESA